MSPALHRRTLITGLTGLATTAAVAGAAASSASAQPAPAETQGTQPLIGPIDDDRVHVMAFNIRQRRTDTAPGDADHWPERAPILADLLEREQPGILGVQEALSTQLGTIDAALPGHRRVGYGRQGGSRDEYSALYYDAERFAVLEWDQVWLSDTPLTIGSTSWGNEIPRILVWATLRDRRTGSSVAVVNTHFDHRSAPARARSAEAVRELVEGETFGDLPVIVTGDFNADARGSEPLDILVTDGPLTDTWDSAARKLTEEWGTFLGYEEPIVENSRIDWVLVGEGISVYEAAINVATDPRTGRYPSDHAAVQALVGLP